MKTYDVSGVAAEFIAGRLPERRELISEFQQAVLHSRVMKQFLAEFLQATVQNGNLKPTEVVQFAIVHGMALGVLCEKERQDRKRRIV